MIEDPNFEASLVESKTDDSEVGKTAWGFKVSDITDEDASEGRVATRLAQILEFKGQLKLNPEVLVRGR